LRRAAAQTPYEWKKTGHGLTVDDVLDVLEEDTTKDFQETAAVDPLKMS
jgi:hypothetical protein